LSESVFRVFDSLAIIYSVTGTIPERMGTATVLAALYNHCHERLKSWWR
jgi:hypothetical protein